MARVRLLSDEEYIQSLSAYWREDKEKADKLKVEYEIAEKAYQCISDGLQGGLDSGLAKQFLFTGSMRENQMPLIEGLDLAKAVFFLHSKLCISDPVVQAVPRKQDSSTKRATEYAQIYLPYMRKRMNLQEKAESGPYLNTCIYGSGIFYNGFDPEGGSVPFDEFPTDPAELEKKLLTGFKMEGDYDLRDVHPRKFFPDSAATHRLDIRHTFEEWELPFEEAMYRFNGTDQQNILRQHHKAFRDTDPLEKSGSRNTIKLYVFFQKGAPWNGFLGSHAILVDPESPKLIHRGPNFFRHRQIPYNILTDVDVPNNVLGMSRIVYAYQAQLAINNLLYLITKNIALFGGNKLLLPEGALNQEALNNSLDDVVFYNAATGGKPEQIRTGNVTTDVWRAYEIHKNYINNIYGMNEFSQGQIPRELSSYAVQFAIEMDDKYRIRLFNKKKAFLRDIHYMGLENTKQYMTEQRRLNIAGLEKFTDDGYFNAANLEGDYDIDCEFGPYLPVDPAARKQQILEFIKSGFFEKAGGNMKKAASLLVDGSMLDVKEEFEQSPKRQITEIDRIINGDKVELHPWDHDEDHAAAVEEFTKEQMFESLDIQTKQAIWDHGQAHVKRLAEKIAKTQQQQPGAGGPSAAPGMPPPAAGSTPPPPGGAKPAPSPVTMPTSPIG